MQMIMLLPDGFVDHHLVKAIPRQHKATVTYGVSKFILTSKCSHFVCNF